MTLVSIRRAKQQNNTEELTMFFAAANLLAAIDRSEDEISQSTVFAVASILEGVSFINGSPQNTFVPGRLNKIVLCK